MTNGAEYTYAYDVDGTRIWKNSGGGPSHEFYANDPDGKTEVADEVPYGENITINLWANGDNIGQVRNNRGSISHYYYLKDHLGDIKMILNSSGGVDSYNDYYPFGEQMPGRNSAGSADGRYKYISVEQDVETGYDAMGARLYDPWSGRFRQTDILSDLYPDQSPYSYSYNNPILFEDASGDSANLSTDAGWVPPLLIVPPVVPGISLSQAPILDFSSASLNVPEVTSIPAASAVSSTETLSIGPVDVNDVAQSAEGSIATLGFATVAIENYVHNPFTTLGTNWTHYSNFIHPNQVVRSAEVGKELALPIRGVGIGLSFLEAAAVYITPGHESRIEVCRDVQYWRDK